MKMSKRPKKPQTECEDFWTQLLINFYITKKCGMEKELSLKKTRHKLIPKSKRNNLWMNVKGKIKVLLKKLICCPEFKKKNQWVLIKTDWSKTNNQFETYMRINRSKLVD